MEKLKEYDRRILWIPGQQNPLFLATFLNTDFYEEKILSQFPLIPNFTSTEFLVILQFPTHLEKLLKLESPQFRESKKWLGFWRAILRLENDWKFSFSSRGKNIQETKKRERFQEGIFTIQKRKNLVWRKPWKISPWRWWNAIIWENMCENKKMHMMMNTLQNMNVRMHVCVLMRKIWRFSNKNDFFIIM